jgi:putative ABC transport system ATP-binding protein
MPAEAAVQAIGLTRTFAAGRRQVRSLDEVSLAVASGEVVAVMGPSGSGKSTLLHLLGGLDRPDQGRALIAGVDWESLRGRARARFRRRRCGFIAQSLTLLPQATVAENVEVPLLLDGAQAATRRRRVADALERVGLADAAAKLPDQLSGGQRQRVAIARVLCAQPAVVLADEPTGSLDSGTAEAITRLLVAAAAEQRAAVVLVTHDPAVAQHADRVVGLRCGRLDASVRAEQRPGGAR